jgi:hypothetical protein
MMVKSNGLFFIILLLFIGCGKKTISQNFIQEDERPSTSQENGTLNFSDEFIEETQSSVEVDPFLKCEGTSIQREFIVYGTMIEQLGGVVSSPLDYENDLADFQSFLNLSKSLKYTAADLSKIGSPDIAKNCGITTLLPPTNCWLRSVALTLLLEKIGAKHDIPVNITSFWRPPCYNKALGGKRGSDHLEARSIDTSFEIAYNRRFAQAYICKNLWEEDLFNLGGLDNPDSKKLNVSVGIGATWMHVGLGSRRGRRFWTYDSYVMRNEAPNSCW